MRWQEQAHRHHGGFEEAVALEEILRPQLRTIGQQRDPEEIFLFRELIAYSSSLRTVAIALETLVHHEIFEEHDEAAFGRADREEQIDHADDRSVLAQHEDAAAIRLFEDQAQPVQLLLLVRGGSRFPR